MIDIIKAKREELVRKIAAIEAKKIELFSQVKECEDGIEEVNAKIRAYDEVIKDFEGEKPVDVPAEEPAVEETAEEPVKEHIIRISQSGF